MQVQGQHKPTSLKDSVQGPPVSKPTASNRMPESFGRRRGPREGCLPP